MYTVMKIMLGDLRRLLRSERIEVHHNIFLELDTNGESKEDVSEVVRNVHKASPKHVGDKVRVKDLTMPAWGRIKYPRPMGRNDVMNIPEDTLGIVVEVIYGEDPSFVVDLVLNGKLYRMIIEGQYVQAVEEQSEGA